MLETEIVPQLIKVNDKSYFLVDDLNSYDTPYFSGTHRNLRGIIKKKNIPEYAIMYGYVKENKFIVSNEEYVRALKVLFTF